MSSTDELVIKFEGHLKTLNRSAKTISAYLENVRSFLKTMGCKDMKSVTKRMVEKYIADLSEYRTKAGNGYTINTICLKVRSINRFFEYLEKANIIFIDPTESIKEPKRKKGLPKEVLTPKEIDDLLEQPDLGTPLGIRDRTIMELLYSTGIRLDEFCCLSLFDADLQGQALTINKGKGSKDRVVPMGEQAAKYLKLYITKVRSHFTKNDKNNRNLFVDIHGKPISKQAVSVMIKRYVEKSGISKNVTPHTFRHTFASGLIKNGAEFRAVQAMLGHVYAKTTQIYIRSLGLDIKKVHKKTHPREKDKESSKTIEANIERILPKDE